MFSPPPLNIILLIPALAAGLVFLPTISGGFLTDDLVFAKGILLIGPEGGVNWDLVGRHFTGPWMGIGRIGYYRPLVTLSLALDGWVGGGSPLAFHLTNILLHCVVTLLLTCLCCRCCPKHPRLAALTGGMLFALHPIGTDSVAFIANRVSSLELVFRLASMLAFARYLAHPGRRPLAWTAFWAVLAFLSKESAFILPVAYVALDIVLPSSRTLRRRLIPHVVLSPVWGGYLLLRFGWFGGEGIAHSAVRDLTAAGLGSLPQKLGQMFLPSTGDSVELMTITMACCAALALALAACSWSGRVAVLLGAVWILVESLPTNLLPVGPGMMHARFSYGTIATFALVLSLLVAPSQVLGRKARLLVATSMAVMLLNLVGLTIGTLGWTGRFFASWDAGLTIQKQIDEVGAEASEEVPLAFLSIWGTTEVFPAVLLPNQLHVFTERPGAARDYPMVNLCSVLVPTVSIRMGPGLENISTLPREASPLRAVWHQGCDILLARPEGGYFSPKRHELPPDLTLHSRSGDGKKQRFTFAQPVSPFAIEGLAIRLRPGSRLARLRCRVGWVDTTQTVRGELRVDARVDRDFGTVALDLTNRLEFLYSSLGADHTLLGFEIESSNANPDILAVEAIGRVPTLQLVRTLGGRTLQLDQFRDAVTAPRGTSPDAAMRLVILGPHGVIAQRVRADEPVVLSEGVSTILVETMGLFYRQGLFYYYFEQLADPDAGRLSRRSEVDRFRLPSDF